MAVIKEKRCYTVQEIQEILNISRPSAYNLIKKGEFHSVFVAGRHMISKASFDSWLNGVEVEPEGNNSAKNNRNESNEHDESYHLQNENGRTKDAFSDTNMTNVDSKQEPAKYQEIQERFLQSCIKACMMINRAEHMEKK